MDVNHIRDSNTHYRRKLASLSASTTHVPAPRRMDAGHSCSASRIRSHRLTLPPAVLLAALLLLTTPTYTSCGAAGGSSSSVNTNSNPHPPVHSVNTNSNSHPPVHTVLNPAEGGQPAPKCMYSFVVNELDTAKCPLLLHGYGYQREQATQRGQSRRTEAQYDTLVKRIQTVEEKLFQGVRESDSLAKNIEGHENLLKSTQIKLLRQETNLTRLTQALEELNRGLREQRTYYKDLDAKLAGVVMDVAEVGARMRKSDTAGVQQSLADKHIPVQSAPLSNTCGLSKNATRFKDCEDIYLNGHTDSGVYFVTPLYTNCPIPVYCDMDTPPGGWMVIQRRRTGHVSFSKDWNQYRAGFGDVTGEYWLGLDNIFLITNQMHYKLRVDLWDFYESRVYAEYHHFYIRGARDQYKLHVSNHTGTAPDGLSNHNGVAFSTHDKDNDGAPNYHCAREWGAGWWFNNCWFVILNGPYYNNTDVKYRGISWNDWKTEQLKETEMKIRPYGH